MSNQRFMLRPDGRVAESAHGEWVRYDTLIEERALFTQLLAETDGELQLAKADALNARAYATRLLDIMRASLHPDLQPDYPSA